MSDALDEMVEKEAAQWQYVQTTPHFWTFVTPVGYVKGPLRFPDEEAVKKWIRKRAAETVEGRLKGEEF